ncbi:hypothetical protein BH23VER1_BH23VER1_17900 [soil metagenome]
MRPYDDIGNRHPQSQGHADLATVAGAGDTPGSGTRTAYTADALNQYTSTTGIAPSHDDDGSLLADGDFACAWDAENHLAAIKTTGTLAQTDKIKETYAYDHRSRRISKTHTWDGGTGTYTDPQTTLYLYDTGWHLPAEVDASSGALVRAYGWSPDLSGTPGGAGGVGGLALTYEPAAAAGEDLVAAGYDGNGNVVSLVRSGTAPAAVGTYKYGAFGELIAIVGDAAKDNPLRFSTKCHDDGSALLYYGFQYYSPAQGRWLSRDPMGERGGVNLYGHVGNDANNRVDFLGLFEWVIGASKTGKSEEFDATYPAKAPSGSIIGVLGGGDLGGDTLTMRTEASVTVSENVATVRVTSELRNKDGTLDEKLTSYVALRADEEKGEMEIVGVEPARPVFGHYLGGFYVMEAHVGPTTKTNKRIDGEVSPVVVWKPLPNVLPTGNLVPTSIKGDVPGIPINDSGEYGKRSDGTEVIFRAICLPNPQQ